MPRSTGLIKRLSEICLTVDLSGDIVCKSFRHRKVGIHLTSAV